MERPCKKTPTAKGNISACWDLGAVCATTQSSAEMPHVIPSCLLTVPLAFPPRPAPDYSAFSKRLGFFLPPPYRKGAWPALGWVTDSIRKMGRDFAQSSRKPHCTKPAAVAGARGGRRIEAALKSLVYQAMSLLCLSATTCNGFSRLCDT